MSRSLHAARQPVPSVLPPEYEILALEPLLLPGESREQYHVLRQMILSDIAPQSAIEWLLAIDVVELSWETRRYRLLRHKLIAAYRHKAIEVALRRIDLPGVADEFKASAESYIVRNSLSWNFDPAAATEIENRLAAYGFDQHALSTEVYLQMREQYLLFEGLINSAYTHRTNLLREIGCYRSKSNSAALPSSPRPRMDRTTI